MQSSITQLPPNVTLLALFEKSNAVTLQLQHTPVSSFLPVASARLPLLSPHLSKRLLVCAFFDLLTHILVLSVMCVYPKEENWERYIRQALSNKLLLLAVAVIKTSS